MKISKRERVTSEENREKLKKEERIKFGQNLKERRRLLNLTQENVADRLNITVTAYSKIERGDTGVNMDRIRQLARALPDFITFLRHYMAQNENQRVT